jgi:hypothetical protein
MDYNYYYPMTGAFPNLNVVFDRQGEPQQQVFMQPNLLTQFQIWEPGPTHSTTASQQEPGNVTYKTVMQDIAAVFTMIEKSTTSISTAMCALKQMTGKLMYNTK